MIELLINNLPADLPADFSFDMSYENEFFTNASEYSLDIELPLEGSPANRKIFGHLNRITTPKGETTFEVVGYANGRTVCYGYAVLLSISEKSVSIQLVGNTSYFNYYAADKYIDEMDLGYALVPQPEKLRMFEYDYHVSEFRKLWGSVDDADMVLFWAFYKDPKEVVDSTWFPQRVPNSPFPSFVESGDASMWVNNLYRYSCQPYLLKVIQRVVSAMGFKIRRNDISHSWLRHLYICNYRESKANDWFYDDENMGLKMTDALPHWTLSTFIDEIEKLCACVFLFNTHNKTVDIVQLDKFYNETTAVDVIPDSQVIDEYEVEYEDEPEEKDLASGNISFNKEYTDKYLSVDPEVLESIQTTKACFDMGTLLAVYNEMTLADRQKTLFVNGSTGREYICQVNDDGQDTMKEVNVFGALTRDDEEARDVQLNIVPANTRLFNVGWWFDQFRVSPTIGMVLQVPFTSETLATDPTYTTAQDIIENSYSGDKQGEEKQCMEVMISTGETYPLVVYSGDTFSYPVPFTDFNMETAGRGHFPEMSLSLKDVCADSLGHLYRNIPNYRSNKKFIIKFISSFVPDVRQIFQIHNQRYVCRKLSVTFSSSATTFIFEGEFYRLD